MTTKHTSGPWRVKHSPKLGWAGVLTKKGDIVADISIDEMDFRDPKQARADARLIATAPELLEACDLLIKAKNDVEDGLFGRYYEAVEAAEAAIKKARGES